MLFRLISFKNDILHVRVAALFGVQNLFARVVSCHNSRLLDLPDHALPALNHDPTDHNT